jgi:hypothetical protein
VSDSSGRRHAVAAVRSALLLVGVVLVALGLASPVRAGDSIRIPTYSVGAACVDDDGVITVVLLDGTFPATYDITIAGVLVGAGLAEGTYEYSSYAAGDYEVKLEFTTGDDASQVLDIDTWTVRAPCAGTTTTAAPTTAAPTTAAPTTAAPTTAAPSTAPDSGAASSTTSSPSAAPTLPVTGQPSGGIAQAAVLLTVLGGALLLVVRQARRA